MRRWKYTIHFRDIILNKELSPWEAAEQLGERLRAFYNDHESWLKDDSDYIDLMEFFEEGHVNTVYPWCPVFTVEDFDSALSDLYDWCDSNNVWVELHLN